MKDLLISVVIPFYDEAESLEMVCEVVRVVLSTQSGLSWELVMVDDGSMDETSVIRDELSQKYENFRLTSRIANTVRVKEMNGAEDR